MAAKVDLYDSSAYSEVRVETLWLGYGDALGVLF